MSAQDSFMAETYRVKLRIFQVLKGVSIGTDRGSKHWYEDSMENLKALFRG